MCIDNLEELANHGPTIPSSSLPLRLLLSSVLDVEPEFKFAEELLP